MSADTNALTRHWFDEVWNKRRALAMDEILSPETVVHGLAEGG